MGSDAIATPLHPEIVASDVNPWQPERVFFLAGHGGLHLDEQTIRGFLATDYPPLVAAVSLACGSRAAAEDAVQEALARAWERGERGEHIESLRAWVMKVAINLVRSGFRRMLAERRARERLAARPVEFGSSLPTVAGTEDAVDVGRALAALPRRQREAAVLRYYIDLSVLEVASVLGVSEGTAKTTLFRARRALAGALGGHGAEYQEEANDIARS